MGENEIKILNRFIKLKDSGLVYEADPWHTDLLAAGFGLQKGNGVSTPGVKDAEADPDIVKNDERDHFRFIQSEPAAGDKAPDLDYSLKNIQCAVLNVAGRSSSRRVAFSEDVTEHEVMAYSDHYPLHPSQIVTLADKFVRAKPHVCRFTSKSIAVMNARHAKTYNNDSSRLAQSRRRLILTQLAQNVKLFLNDCTEDEVINSIVCHICPPSQRHDNQASERFVNGIAVTITDTNEAAKIWANTALDKSANPAESWLRPYGAELKDVVSSVFFATRPQPAASNKYKKRMGAKKAKSLERLESKGFELSPAEATTYRALAARSNYLAQDRCDIAFAAKELCREFATPTKKSHEKLKRLARYVTGAPRLTYQFPYQSKQPGITVYVDTDFAGCKSTRRSTSGGFAMYGSHQIKHCSKTQSTVCLSSGEAELRGIAEGLAQAIGLQTIAKDLGFDWTIDVHSDATAAIGIARRRGMGRIRHIDCTDLWCQEKFNSGQAKLHNILGTENPADILTKHVDRGTLLKMLGMVGVKFLDGRSAIAPKTEGINSVSTRRGRRDLHRTAECISVVNDCGKGSNREGDRPSFVRTSDPKAALAPETFSSTCKSSNVSAGPMECAKICSVSAPRSKVYPKFDVSTCSNFDIEITHDCNTTTRQSRHTTSTDHDAVVVDSEDTDIGMVQTLSGIVDYFNNDDDTHTLW